MTEPQEPKPTQPQEPIPDLRGSQLELDPPPPPEPEPVKPLRLRRRLRIMIGLLILLVLAGVNLAIGKGKLHFEKVLSESMEPTLLVGDVLFCDTDAVVARDAIFVLDDPTEAGAKLVKRVIAMPGDQLTIDHGILYLKKVGEHKYEQQTRDYVRNNQTVDSDGRWKLADNQIFVMGDNRNNSEDSRDFGPVGIDTVLGKVDMIVWPPSRWQRPPQPGVGDGS